MYKFTDFHVIVQNIHYVQIYRFSCYCTKYTLCTNLQIFMLLYKIYIMYKFTDFHVIVQNIHYVQIYR